MDHMWTFFHQRSNSESHQEIAKKAGHGVVVALEKYSKYPILLLLSGGSSFDILKFVDIPTTLKSFTVGMVDERFSTDQIVNNFSQFMAEGGLALGIQKGQTLGSPSFYDRAELAGASFIDSRVKPEESILVFCKRLEQEIEAWMKENPSGKIITTLGIGEDGHIAGIMPYPNDPDEFKNLFEKYVGWIVAYDAGDKNKYPLRVTANNWFLRQKVDYAVVYAVGGKKKSALTKVFAKVGTLAETPARIIYEMKNVQIFTDQKII